MLSEKMEEALNNQINAELQSFYDYLSMASYLQSIDLSGISHWMHMQAQEELGHAMKIYEFVHERNGRIVLQSLGKPGTDYQDVMAVFTAALNQEEAITRKINEIVDLAIQEADHATHTFMQWFVSEQVEEVASAHAIIQKLKLIGEAPGGLFLLDQELGKRGPEGDA